MLSDESIDLLLGNSPSTAAAAQTDELEPRSAIYSTPTLGVAYWKRIIKMRKVRPTVDAPCDVAGS